MILEESECDHSIGSAKDGAHPSPKTDRDRQMKDNLGCYCLKPFETAKKKKEKWCRRVSNSGLVDSYVANMPFGFLKADFAL